MSDHSTLRAITSSDRLPIRPRRNDEIADWNKEPDPQVKPVTCGLEAAILQSEMEEFAAKYTHQPIVMQVCKSSVEPGRYYLDVGTTRHYGATPLEAIGQAALDGALGILNFKLP